MLGAIAGDIIGSVYETHPIKTTEFPLFRWDSVFTDDTVLTVAVADAVLTGAPYADKLRQWFLNYPNRGYGGFFRRWASRRDAPAYGSWGNGSAMRVSPIGFAFDTLGEVLAEAERSAAVTHDHPDGIAGAQTTAGAVYLARTGATRDQLREWVERTFPAYRLDRTLVEIRPSYRFDPSCLGTVPPAITAALESTDYEDAVRKAVSLGGDSDTLACIAGSIAEAFHGVVPAAIAEKALEYLDAPLADVLHRFQVRYL
jgi:ADP-ribosylglycohydrolase